MGTSLALWLVAAGARLVAVAGRDPGRPLDGRLPAVPRVGLADLVSVEADLLLVAVADPALAAVAELLARRPQARVVLHVSGPLDASVLAPLAAKAASSVGGSSARGSAALGSAIGTLHPLRAFPEVLPRPAAGTVYALDGDVEALALARRLAAAFAGQTVEVAGEARTVYHLAATLAAGGVTTVLALLAELLAAAGLPRTLLAANLHLMDGALEAVRRAAREEAEDPETFDRAIFDRAITGPAVRGDLATLARQRAALLAIAPRLLGPIAALQDEALTRGRRLRGEESGEESGEEPLRESSAESANSISSASEKKPPVQNPERE